MTKDGGCPLLSLTDRGLFCSGGDFYIDPWKPVERAVVTHAHADHARPGHRHYLAHPLSEAVLRARLGAGLSIQTLPCGAPVEINGVRVTFFPAGHIPGSVQVRVEHRGETMVAAGDYKTGPDGLSEPWEPVPCRVFITESTFGLPVYRWKPAEEVFGEINQWWSQNRDAGKTSFLFAWSLGKAQRILAGIDPGIGPVRIHESIQRMNDCLRGAGLNLPDFPVYRRRDNGQTPTGTLVVLPPSAAEPVLKRSDAVLAQASGWMAVRGNRRRLALDRGFVLSDHADWEGLNRAVAATGAERVLVTHGQTEAFARWLCQKGYEATPLPTRFGGESGEGEASVTPS